MYVYVYVQCVRTPFVRRRTECAALLYRTRTRICAHNFYGEHRLRAPTPQAHSERPAVIVMMLMTMAMTTAMTTTTTHSPLAAVASCRPFFFFSLSLSLPSVVCVCVCLPCSSLRPSLFSVRTTAIRERKRRERCVHTTNCLVDAPCFIWPFAPHCLLSGAEKSTILRWSRQPGAKEREGGQAGRQAGR